MKNNKVVAYYRNTTRSKQIYERGKENLKVFAEAKGFVLIDMVCDKKSCKRFCRPKLMKTIYLAKKHKAAYILVDRIGCIHRAINKLIKLDDRLAKHGIRIYVAETDTVFQGHTPEMQVMNICSDIHRTQSRKL